MNPPSARIRYFAFGTATVVAGLVVHVYETGLPAPARDIAGDALWAMMMASWVSGFVPRIRSALRCLAALMICFAVEWSQLWQLPALEYGRSTAIGRLVLGSGFDLRDFGAYTIGILVFMGLDRLVLMRGEPA